MCLKKMVVKLFGVYSKLILNKAKNALNDFAEVVLSYGAMKHDISMK